MSTGVLLACADPALAEQFRLVLAESPAADLVEVVVGSADLAAAADRDDVDIVVVHDRIGPTPAGQLTRELVEARPHRPVLWLGAAAPDLLSRAVEAGARSALAAPLDLEVSQSRIEAAAAWGRAVLAHARAGGASSGPRGAVLAVAGAKGGVGTTVLATVLAGAATQPSRPVVLVDLDVRTGAVAFYADIRPRRSIADLAQVAGELNARSVQEVVHRHPGGLSLIVAPEDIERAEDVTGEAVRQILTQLRTQYAHVVVDCGSRLDDAVASALELADRVCLVTTPDIVAVRAARKTLADWERLGLRRSDAVSVLVNRVSRRTEVQPDLIRQILPAPVAGLVPAGFRSLEPGINTGLLDGRPGQVQVAIMQVAEQLGLPAGRAGDAPARTRRQPQTRQPRQRRDPRPRRPAQDPRRVGRPAPGWNDPRIGGRAAREAGQVVAELPLMVFMVGIAALACLQMVVLGASHVFAGHAALEAARTAAVGGDPAAVAAAVDGALPPSWNSGFSVRREGTDQVVVRVATPRLFPLPVDLHVEAGAHIEVER